MSMRIEFGEGPWEINQRQPEQEPDNTGVIGCGLLAIILAIGIFLVGALFSQVFGPGMFSNALYIVSAGIAGIGIGGIFWLSE